MRSTCWRRRSSPARCRCEFIRTRCSRSTPRPNEFGPTNTRARRAGADVRLRRDVGASLFARVACDRHRARMNSGLQTRTARRAGADVRLRRDVGANLFARVACDRHRARKNSGLQTRTARRAGADVHLRRDVGASLFARVACDRHRVRMNSGLQTRALDDNSSIRPIYRTGRCGRLAKVDVSISSCP